MKVQLCGNPPGCAMWKLLPSGYKFLLPFPPDGPALFPPIPVPRLPLCSPRLHLIVKMELWLSHSHQFGALTSALGPTPPAPGNTTSPPHSHRSPDILPPSLGDTKSTLSDHLFALFVWKRGWYIIQPHILVKKGNCFKLNQWFPALAAPVPGLHI